MGDGVGDAKKPGKAAKDKPRAPYSSVVYFHGMGSQRRYEETSRLIDRIDLYLGNRFRRSASVGMLSEIKAQVEPLRGCPGSSGIVGYIRTKFSTSAKMEDVQGVRFYEVYWAPVMAEQKSPWRVLKWIFAQPLRPWRTLRAPWRERQRLRRASLVALFERDRAALAEPEKQDYGALLALYDLFESPEALRHSPNGSFAEFQRFIGERHKTEPETARRCQALAEKWLAAYQAEELRNAFALVTTALALVLLGGAVLLGALAALQSLLGFAPLATVLREWDVPLKADWKTAGAVVVAVAGLFGLGRFLSDYMGDVEAWATYEETDIKHEARNKVLDRSLELLTHVLSDEACKRVTIVAHSLGTSVAHDALLALTRRNLAHNPEDAMAGPVPLPKIEHFVTMGSPIDKIEYFFESYSSTSHRYKRVIETFRGDIGTAPFSRNHKPYIHWINFWDQGDAISGALHSPAGSENLVQRVDNIHVASLHFPAPGASHSGYFDNETVIESLFEVIYQRAGSFRTLTQPGPEQPYDYESVYQGPGEPLGARAGFVRMAAAIPWLALAGVLGWAFKADTVTYAAGGLLATLIALLGLGYVASAVAGQRKPL